VSLLCSRKEAVEDVGVAERGSKGRGEASGTIVTISLLQAPDRRGAKAEILSNPSEVPPCGGGMVE